MKSLARPGGNVTGVTLLDGELGGKQLELLKEEVPELSRVAVLYEQANQNTISLVKEVLAGAANSLGLTLQPRDVLAPEGFALAFVELRKQGPDGLYVLVRQLPPLQIIVNRFPILALKSRCRRCTSGENYGWMPAGLCATGRIFSD